MRQFLETNVGPVTGVVKILATEPAKLATFRDELDDLISRYFNDNIVRQDFLMTRARKI